MPLDQIDVDQYDVKKVKEMSFFEHLEELRWHIIRSAIVVVAMMLVVFSMGNWVFDKIIFGPKNENFVTYRVMCNLASKLHASSLCIKPPVFNNIATGLGETFFTHMQIAFVLGFMVSFPYVFWEFWRFVSPGLHDNERKNARGIVLICSLLFASGVLFGYFIIAPFAISFLAGYTLPQVTIMPTLASYIEYMVMFTLPIGLVFELPIVIYFLSKLGIVNPAFLRKYRKHMVVVILIVAGIITPSPDIVSQLLVGVPLYILFEVSIIVSSKVHKNKAIKKAKAALLD
jgi:sec-independent protein translocase protein TatC